MPIIHGPVPDPSEPRRRRAPKGLARLRAKFTYDRQLKEFRKVFARDPADDSELDSFVEEFTREMYNSGWDEIPE